MHYRFDIDQMPIKMTNQNTYPAKQMFEMIKWFGSDETNVYARHYFVMLMMMGSTMFVWHGIFKIVGVPSLFYYSILVIPMTMFYRVYIDLIRRMVPIYDVENKLTYFPGTVGSAPKIATITVKHGTVRHYVHFMGCCCTFYGICLCILIIYDNDIPNLNSSDRTCDSLYGMANLNYLTEDKICGTWCIISYVGYMICSLVWILVHYFRLYMMQNHKSAVSTSSR